MKELAFLVMVKPVSITVGEMTGISPTSHHSPLATGIWYTLDGRRLSGKPTAKGIYINNGQKVIIK